MGTDSAVESFKCSLRRNRVPYVCMSTFPMSTKDVESALRTHRTWDSWTSSCRSSNQSLCLRSTGPGLKQSPRWAEYTGIPWTKILSKVRPASSSPVTSLYRFRNVLEPRHGCRFGTERSISTFQAEAMTKSPQLPSEQFMYCLLCGSPGHLCNECDDGNGDKHPDLDFYETTQTAHRHEVGDRQKKLKTLDSGEVDQGFMSPEQAISTTDQSVIQQFLGTISGAFDVKVPISLERGLSSTEPILCQVDRECGSPCASSPCKFHKLDLLEPHGGAHFGSCINVNRVNQGFKGKRTNNLPTYCFICGSLGHFSDECRSRPYCSFRANRKAGRGARASQSAQMSFRIKRPKKIANPFENDSFDGECDCQCCRSNYELGRTASSSTDTEDSALRRPRKGDPYEEFEREFDHWFNGDEKDYAAATSWLESEESVALICGKVNGVETTMLLDTGSSISAITESFARELELETWYTEDVLVVTLANTHVERYPERTCIVTMHIGDLEICDELNVLPGQIYNITLGKNWLKRHMAICDYGLDILRLPGSRPIKMGISTSIPPLRTSLRSKKKGRRVKRLAQTTSLRPYYPSLHSLLCLGGWLPPRPKRLLK